MFFSIVGLALKYGISFLEFRHVIWLLEPVKEIVELSTGWSSQKIDEGFLFSNNILLSFECSGIHYFTISFLSFWFLYSLKINYFVSCLKAIGLAYILTIVANASRILFFVNDFSILIQEGMPKDLAHQLLGGIIFSFWLLTVSFFIHHSSKSML